MRTGSSFDCFPLSVSCLMFFGGPWKTWPEDEVDQMPIFSERDVLEKCPRLAE